MFRRDQVMQKLFFPGLIVLIFSIQVNSQSIKSCAVTVNVSVVKGVGVSSLNKNLDQGDTELNSFATTVSGNSVNVFEISGSPDKSVIVNYNNSPSNLQSNYSSGNEGIVKFIPNVEFSNNLNFSNAQPMLSGNYYLLTDYNGSGLLYLKVGGTLQINQNQPTGDYESQFTITVSY
jgi:hypothetical protein